MDSANSVAIIVCTLERARPPRERCLHAIRRSEHRLNKSFLASISNRSIDRSLLTVRPSVSLRASPSSEQCNADFPLTFSPNWKASQEDSRHAAVCEVLDRRIRRVSVSHHVKTSFDARHRDGFLANRLFARVSTEPCQWTSSGHVALFFLFFFPPNESENDEIHHRDDLPWREC